MSGYPQHPPGYGYGAPPPSQQHGSQPYGSAPYGAPPPQGYATPYGAPPPPQPHGQSPYGGAPTAQPYGGAPSAQPYGGAPSAQPYGGAPSAQPYGGAPSAQPYGGAPSAQPYGGAPSAQPYGGAPSAPPYDHNPGKPPKDQSSSATGAATAYPPSAQGYSPFSALVPSTFPPGTDPNVVACFRIADQDGSGLIDDKELQRALSNYNQSFSLRTVHLLMYLFTNSNSRKIG